MKIGPNMFNLVTCFLLKYPIAQILYGIVYQQVALRYTVGLRNILFSLSTLVKHILSWLDTSISCPRDKISWIIVHQRNPYPFTNSAM